MRFFKTEAGSGIILLGAALLAMIFANTGLRDVYVQSLSSSLGPFTITEWINDGLMALFFFVIGLEIKSEMMGGSLSSRDRAALPVVAALGGMVAPALLYLLFRQDRGWGIPMATDIAFALGVLSLFRVAPAIRVFLLALAVVDDLGAVIVIAVFYTSQIHWLALVSALAYFAAAYVFRNSKWIFALFAVATWWFVHQSGVHATIAGCALGFIAPDPRRLATRLHPYTAFIVMPLFAFANAGLDLSGAWHFNPIEIAIVVALLIGKPLGILSASWTALHFKFAHAEFRFRDLAGVACLGGIGFTMSIFVARLAFAGDALEVAKLGVVKGSLLSALLGSSLLMMTKRMRRSEEHRSSP